ncbi:MAG: rRNA maturation RNase YbeY [Candidatus Pacebacteria bacterium]|nr:rRNA maturation RNase YbeY [Candidatus Paceibacterota bacterium]
MSALGIRNLTRAKLPVVPYARIAKAILPSWEVSLAFVGPTEAKRLNRSLRKKSYVPNVLSYASDTKSGEVIICLQEAKKQAPEYDLSYPQFVAFLFIHALLHLKGMPHGPTMEKRERALLARFVSLHNGTKNRNGNRHRKSPSKGGSRRGGTR